tara:strand:- start:86 stop:205 length:120 start_codon:yes stop_codon:yes gene_type:complete
MLDLPRVLKRPFAAWMMFNTGAEVVKGEKGHSFYLRARR